MVLTSEIEERVLASPALPSLPEVAVRIIRLSRDPAVGVDAIVECLKADPALVQKILRAVNSPLYGLQTKISNIKLAAGYLGLNTLKGLVLGFTLLRERSDESGNGFSMTAFWRHSLTSAVAAGLLASRLSLAQVEEAFVGGLLQDIGVLALNRALPEEYAPVLARHREALAAGEAATAEDGRSLLCRIEQDLLGTDHARIGGRLCAAWGLPDVLAIPIRFHHAPADLEGQPTDTTRFTRILHLSALVAQMFNGASQSATLTALDHLAQTYFNLDRADVGVILARIDQQVTEAAEALEIQIGQPHRYDEILEQANVELVNLTLQAQRAAEAEAQNKVAVERRARQLESLAVELAERANRDALTGVFNRGFLDRFLAEQFRSGRDAGQPIGLILIDVHRFKAINDTYGHPQGDAVLRELADRLRRATRDSDLVSRYGGDEFVVVLPQADLDAVRRIASRVRTAVWDRPFALLAAPAADGQAAQGPVAPTTAPARTLNVSIGIGAVCVADYARAQGPAQVLAAADKLLYTTKRLRDRKIGLVRI